MIPVVYGAEDVHKVAPPHSYIDVRDFKSPKHLAEYLIYLDKNEKKYAEYFQWKQYYDVHLGATGIKKVFCDFCKYLSKTSKHTVVPDFRDWFFEKSKSKPLPPLSMLI